MLSSFVPDVVRDEAARTEKLVGGLRLDLQGFVRTFRPTTHADALRLAVDMSLHERANSSKAEGRGLTLGACYYRKDFERTACVLGLWDILWRSLLSKIWSLFQGKVFATTRYEVEQAGSVVTGTLPILGHFAFVLFDSRSSHSFISSVFV
ncbi:gag-protease polyprotein [Cucumis melo var. makuwa]|uniref:Gag-protease polyprotein n=1 Tax=Cucumis melo var. makuwa TaxID=1194695 RepID=A0A5A7SR54_CUCMM|nr:gag-protease polyprotein [Cucumis melo var. makuwa]